MSNKLLSPEHYLSRLQKIEQKIRNLAVKSHVLQAGGISNRYRYLAKTYNNAYKRLKKLQKDVTVPSIEDIEMSLNINNNTFSYSNKQREV